MYSNSAIQLILDDLYEHNITVLKDIISEIKDKEYFILNTEIIPNTKYFGHYKENVFATSKYVFDCLYLILSFLNYDVSFDTNLNTIENNYTELNIIIKKRT